MGQLVRPRGFVEVVYFLGSPGNGPAPILAILGLWSEEIGVATNPIVR